MRIECRFMLTLCSGCVCTLAGVSLWVCTCTGDLETSSDTGVRDASIALAVISFALRSLYYGLYITQVSSEMACLCSTLPGNPLCLFFHGDWALLFGFVFSPGLLGSNCCHDSSLTSCFLVWLDSGSAGLGQSSPSRPKVVSVLACLPTVQGQTVISCDLITSQGKKAWVWLLQVIMYY